MPYIFVVILGALAAALTLTQPATSKSTSVVLKDKETVQAIVNELQLPDDRKGLVHVILEDARVRVERMNSEVQPILASSGTQAVLPVEEVSMEQLNSETRDELQAVLDEKQMLELSRAIQSVTNSQLKLQ